MVQGTPPPPLLMLSLKSSVLVNGLLVPFRQAIKSVARFCRPLVMYNKDSGYELSFPGSAFALRVGGQNYLIACLHQLGKGADVRSPGEIVILDRRLTPVPAITGREAAIERNLDYFALAFPEMSNDRDLAPLFCRFELDHIFDASEAPADTKVLTYFAIGFPSNRQGYEVEWDEESDAGFLSSATSRWTSIFLEPVERNAFDRDYLQPYKMSEEAAAALRDPDGLSGSPVFMVYQDLAAQTHLGIAGLLQWANKSGRVNVLPSYYLREMLSLPPLPAS